MIEIDVLDRGFVVAADGKRTAYSDVTDLLLDLRLLLSSEPTVIGVDMAAPGSDIGVTAVVSKDSDGTTIVYHEIEDDGWRVWEGGKHAKDYPPGVTADMTVQVRYRSKLPDPSDKEFVAKNLRWTQRDPINGDPQWDIVAYRVVRS